MRFGKQFKEIVKAKLLRVESSMNSGVEAYPPKVGEGKARGTRPKVGQSLMFDTFKREQRSLRGWIGVPIRGRINA